MPKATTKTKTKTKKKSGGNLSGNKKSFAAEHLKKEEARWAEEIREYTRGRHRKGKAALTKEERRDFLQNLYDSSINWMAETMAIGSYKGVGAVSSLLPRIREEIEALDREIQEDKEDKENEGMGYSLVFSTAEELGYDEDDEGNPIEETE